MNSRHPYQDRDRDDLEAIVRRELDAIAALCAQENHLRPSGDISEDIRSLFDRWLRLLQSGNIHLAVRSPWWPNDSLTETINQPEGVELTLQALAAGLQACAHQTTLETAAFTAELTAAREIVDSIDFASEKHRTSLISSCLLITLATTRRSCIRRAMAYYRVFDTYLPIPIPAQIHRIALARVLEDLTRGSIRNFRHFMESSFRLSNPFPLQRARDAAFRGVQSAINRVFAKPTKGRLESLAFIVALGGIDIQEIWLALRPLVLQLVKKNPYLAAYTVDLFFPVSLKGAPNAEEFLRSELQAFFSIDRPLATRMQRHYTAYYDLDWDQVLRGRIPRLSPTARGFPEQSDTTALKHHLIDNYVPARRSQRIPQGVEIIPAQATAVGRLSAEMFSVGFGAYITIVPQLNIEPQYVSRTNSLVIGSSCIAPRSLSGDLYLALGRAFHHMPNQDGKVRLLPTALSVSSVSRYSDGRASELNAFSMVASLLYEVRWFTKRIQSLLRGDEGARAEDERTILKQYEKRIRERLIDAEARYLRCRQHLSLVSQYYQGQWAGTVDTYQSPEWPGMITGIVEVSEDQGSTTVSVPLPTLRSGNADDVDQMLYEQLVQLDPLLKGSFDETIAFIGQTLDPYPALRPTIDFANHSERRRTRGSTIQILKGRSRSLLTSALNTMRRHIGG